MKLTDEFKKARAKVEKQEAAMDSIFDKALNDKILHLNDVSDLYLERHLNEIAMLYSEISHKTDVLFDFPVTKASKSFLLMHVKSLRELNEPIVELVYKLENEVERELLDPDHQLTLARILIGFTNLIDSHNKLILEFTKMVRSQNNDKGQQPPNP